MHRVLVINMPKNSTNHAEKPVQYEFPFSFICRAMVSVLLGRRRDLADDAATALRHVPSPHIVNDNSIPESGSFVLVANHYERKGLSVVWDALAITHAVTRRRADLQGNLHWLMISEWNAYKIGGISLPRGLVKWTTRWVFSRIAYTYNLFLVTADEAKVAQRARMVRKVMASLAPQRRGERLQRRIGPTRDQAVGIFPEAQRSQALAVARKGAGIFLSSLSRLGLPLVPVGLAEREGVLTVSFGEPLAVSEYTSLSKEQRDSSIATEVMVRIGDLLPQHLWGDYASEIIAWRNLRGGIGSH